MNLDYASPNFSSQIGGLMELIKIGSERTSLESQRGPGGFVDINVYRNERAKSELGPDEFDKRFASIFLSPEDRDKFGIGKEETGIETDVAKAMTQFRGSIQQYKNNDWTKEDVERNVRSENKIKEDEEIPIPYQKIIDEVYGGKKDTGFWEKKWWIPGVWERK